MSAKSNELSPVENTKVLFQKATVFARKIDKDNKPISFTGSHRGQRAKCEAGFLLIEKQWNPR
jgi:hypothetical protein